VVLTGLFATPAANPNLSARLSAFVGHTLWIEQIKAIGVAIVVAAGGTVVIACLLKFTIGLRPTIEAEQEGLDLSEHGEEGYIYEPKA